MFAATLMCALAQRLQEPDKHVTLDKEASARFAIRYCNEMVHACQPYSKYSNEDLHAVCISDASQPDLSIACQTVIQVQLNARDTWTLELDAHPIRLFVEIRLEVVGASCATPRPLLQAH